MAKKNRRVADRTRRKVQPEALRGSGEFSVTSALEAGYTADGIAVGADAVREAVGQALGGLRRPASFVLVFPPA
ncbi:MAG TPA: hypothetical protein VHR40_08705, partial [Thermoleophilaceae bacterium]|nr:hypothetical protein [Thermoleophilaceae bacterium]